MIRYFKDMTDAELGKYYKDFLMWVRKRDISLEDFMVGTWEEVEDDASFSGTYTEDKPHFAVLCNDLFAWGSADAESVYPEDIAKLDKAWTDLSELDKKLQAEGAKYEAYEVLAITLWACRKRGERPQKAVFERTFKEYPEEVKELFRACGPNKEEEYWKKWNEEHPDGKA